MSNKFPLGRRPPQLQTKGYVNQQVDLPTYHPPTYKHIGKPYPFRNIKAINTHYMHYKQPYVTNQSIPKTYKLINNMPYNAVYGNPDDIEGFMSSEEKKMTSKTKFQSYTPDAENLRFFSTQRPLGLPQTIDERKAGQKAAEEAQKTELKLTRERDARQGIINSAATKMGRIGRKYIEKKRAASQTNPMLLPPKKLPLIPTPPTTPRIEAPKKPGRKPYTEQQKAEAKKIREQKVAAEKQQKQEDAKRRTELQQLVRGKFGKKP